MTDAVHINGRTIAISNKDKIFFPEEGLTKGDLIDYYAGIADRMVPYLQGRPLTMHRFPDGIKGFSFYQQKASEYFPSWIQRARVEKKQGGYIEHAVCNNAATLCYLANQACITPHVWLSRSDKLLEPDQIIFDLDPPDNDFGRAGQAACHLKDMLEEIGMKSFVKTTGAHGLHVLVPIERRTDFEAARGFAHRVAGLLAKRFPQEVTTAASIAKRSGRVYIDVLRNSYGQTAVAPYAVRALPPAPVAMPLDWSELNDTKLTAQRYTIRNAFRRLEEQGNPWEETLKQAFSVKRAGELLDGLGD